MFGKKSQLKLVVEGCYLKELTAKDYIDLSVYFTKEDAAVSDTIKAMAGFCTVAIVDKDNKLIHESIDDWLDEPYEVVQKCGLAVLAIVTPDKDGEKEENL